MTSEADLAAHVIDWLEKRGWEIGQEVEPRGAGKGPRFDIVAKRGQTLWIVECKARVSIRLLAQALRARDYAHRVSVAHRPPVSAPEERILACLGLGAITVDASGAILEPLRPLSRAPQPHASRKAPLLRFAINLAMRVPYPVC